MMPPIKKRQLALLLSAVLLSGCGGGGGGDSAGTMPPPAIAVSTALAPDKAYRVGDLDKGWLMRIPAGAMGEQPVTLNMRTATADENLRLNVPTDAQVLSLTADGQDNVRLKKLIEIDVGIPPKLAGAPPWELYYGYRTAKGWEYWPFKDVDMAASKAVIEVQHFSWLWGPTQPSKEERLKVYGRTMAAEYTKQALARQALLNNLGPDLDQTLASLGIKDSAVSKDLALNLIGYLESAHLSDDYALTANAALSPLESISTIASGDDEQRKQKSLEVLAKALHWALAKGGPNKWQASGVGALGSLSTAAGAIAGGDRDAAGQAVYSALKGLVTTGAPGSGLVFALGEAAVGAAQNAVDAFTASELEKAYQIYAGTSSGKGYYEVGSGNIEALLAELGGGGRQQELRIIENYCSKRMISPCDLSARERQYAFDQGRASLKAYFEQRQINDGIYKTFENEENKFLAELEKDQFLLVDGYYRDYFKDRSTGFDMEERLQRIYKVRDALRKMFDGANAASMGHRDMLIAIRLWMSHTVDKKRPDFYAWAIEKGYISKSLKPDSVTPPTPPSTGVDFDTARIFEQPWTITENREGLLRAELTRTYDGNALQCAMSVNWELPTSHAQPLQMRVEREMLVNGVRAKDTFFWRFLSYQGRVMPRGDGSFASRGIKMTDPTTTGTRTDLGFRRDLSVLGTEQLRPSFFDLTPTLYLEVQGLCGAKDTTQIRFDYRAR